MSSSGKNKFTLQLQNCAGEQKLGSPRGASQIFCQKWNREGERGGEGKGDGFSTHNQLLTPSQKFHSSRTVDLHRPDHTPWSTLGAEMQGT